MEHRASHPNEAIAHLSTSWAQGQGASQWHPLTRGVRILIILISLVIPSLELDRSVRRDRDTFAYPPQSRHVSGARDSFAAALRGLDGKRIHRESIILWFSNRSGMRSDDQEYFKGVTLVARDKCFLLLFSLYFSTNKFTFVYFVFLHPYSLRSLQWRQTYSHSYLPFDFLIFTCHPELLCWT